VVDNKRFGYAEIIYRVWLILGGMKYWLLAVLLVIGCVASNGGNGGGPGPEPEPVYIDVRDGYFDVVFPDVDGYDLVNMIRVETNDLLDEERSNVWSASYYGDPSFTYTIQELSDVPDLSRFMTKDIDGKVFYYWYDEVIPFVVSGAYDVVWNDGNMFYSISVKDDSRAFEAVENFLAAEGVIDFENYDFLKEIERVPDPVAPWHLYAISEYKKMSYKQTRAYYVQNDLRNVELMLLNGDVDYVVGKMTDALENKTGGGIGSLFFYDGFVVEDEIKKYRIIHKNGEVARIVSTVVDQKDENLEFMTYLIESSGAIQ